MGVHSFILRELWIEKDEPGLPIRMLYIFLYRLFLSDIHFLFHLLILRHVYKKRFYLYHSVRL